MKITLSYFAQIRQAAGAESEALEVPTGSTPAAAAAAAAARHGPEFRRLVLDDSGSIRPSVLVLVNGVPAPRAGGRPLAEGDALSLLSAVSGG